MQRHIRRCRLTRLSLISSQADDTLFRYELTFNSNLISRSLMYPPKFHNIKMNNVPLHLTQCQAPEAECLFISQSAVFKGNWFILMSHWSKESSTVCHSVGRLDAGWRDTGGVPGETHQDKLLPPSLSASGRTCCYRGYEWLTVKGD